MARTELPVRRALVQWAGGRAFAVSLVVSCAGGFAAFHAFSGDAGLHNVDDDSSQVVVASGADRFPNSTANDWVTYADHVIVASVVKERRMPPTSLEIQRGEGLVLRQLTIAVEEVLWSAPGARPAPSDFSWPALGWTFDAKPTYRETRMTGEHTSRLEVGKTYVLAIDSPSTYCSISLDEPEWRGLGAAAILPIEEGTLGAGEFEGRMVSPAETQSEWKHIGASLAASVAGQEMWALKAALNAADGDQAARRSARADKCG